MSFIVEKTVSRTLLSRVQATPNRVGFQFKIRNKWHERSFRQFYDECALIAHGLMSLGIQTGDRVAILSQTRYEWVLSDMAILGIRAVTVPVYPSNTPEDVAYILNQSESSAVFVENAAMLSKIPESEIKKIVLDPLSVSESQAAKVMTLDALIDLGRKHQRSHPSNFEAHLKQANPDDLITICYTSGTTGIPKGVMLTHDNMISVLEDCVAALSRFIDTDGEIVLSFLPFSHILGRVEAMATFTFGWKESFSENLDKLMTNFAEIRPTLVFAVPRIFEKAHARIHSFVDESSPSRKRLFLWAMKVGAEYYQAIRSGKAPSLKTAAEYTAAQVLIFRQIAKRFGGRMRFAVCGGAPLPKEIGEFFQIIGLKVLEGYGLTETCAPVATCLPDHLKFGTVGRPLPEVTVKIADDGEILIKSRKVFKGYFKMPEETAEVLHDGWFHTGDMGLIDDEGFLLITDRKKDIIVTSGGKNIAPQKIENLAKSHKIIHQLVVYGDRKNYLTALVTLDQESIIRYANENHILFSEYSELIKNPKIIHFVQSFVDKINQHLSSFETIKKFLILPQDFTVESGELTPSLKIRRKIVSTKYRTALESLYAEP